MLVDFITAMALTLNEQFHETVNRTRRVLVLMRVSPSVDEITASLAIVEFLKQNTCETTIVSDAFEFPRELSFIPQTKTIAQKISSAHTLNIHIPMSESPEHCDTHFENNELTVSVVPRTGLAEPSLVRSTISAFRYDAIIIVGAHDFASLGAIHTTHTRMFEVLPNITLNVSAAAEQFGAMNINDITFSSISEFIYALFSNNMRYEIKPHIASILLTGIIAATRSFTERNVSGRTLETAAVLIALGANREEIVNNLYRQRTLGTLRAYGAIMSHLQTDGHFPLVWSTVTRDDVVRFGVSERDLKENMQDMFSASTQTRVCAIIYEVAHEPEIIKCIVRAEHPYHIHALMSGFPDVCYNENYATICFKNTELSDAALRVAQVLRVKMRVAG